MFSIKDSKEAIRKSFKNDLIVLFENSFNEMFLNGKNRALLNVYSLDDVIDFRPTSYVYYPDELIFDVEQKLINVGKDYEICSLFVNLDKESFSKQFEIVTRAYDFKTKSYVSYVKRVFATEVYSELDNMFCHDLEVLKTIYSTNLRKKI